MAGLSRVEQHERLSRAIAAGSLDLGLGIMGTGWLGGLE